MDAADFWQQTRAPFGLHSAAAALATNQLHQQQHAYQQQQPLPSIPPVPAADHHHHHTLQQQQQQSQPQHQQQQNQIKHEIHQTSQLLHQQQQNQLQAVDHHHHHQQNNSQMGNHHLLFNAAAAAAAAAHLKSTVLQSNARVGASDTRSNVDPNSNNNVSTKPAEQHGALSTDHLQQQHQVQQQIQGQTNLTNTAEQSYRVSHVGGDLFGQHHHLSQSHPQSSTTHQQSQTQLQQQSQTQLQQQQAECTQEAGSPIQVKSLPPAQHSPQHSTTPSAGSSTPDIKYNNENKLTNDIQLQLSRSNSAAAISERTLEECWSTLQRLFMHKNAMQQIQQQIPRVGLGPHGVSGSASMSSGAETKPHQCQQCMKSFSSNHQLVQHIRVHTGEKPYKCSYCDRRFKQLSHVQQHTRLHTGERPYKCHLPDCGRAFIQLSNLQQHLRNHDAQVERAKNRPFHCNICGKGFATESSLRTHTSKELQLHLGVLQQHAALIGGPNATSCPVCHKLFLGTEALMDHMKHAHKEKSPPPLSAPPATFVDSAVNNAAQVDPSNTGCIQSSSGGGSSVLSDSYLGKRRTANHPCPVCGKHYVNEGSLRKHLACHAETSQLANSLRMWPCSVCQAVFTHENGLLTHMDHMRMDPKHQFAAQYVLSRAAAERRERDSILAATLASSGGGSVGGDTSGMLTLIGDGTGGGSNSMCPSPSANSECSSNGRLSSSATSEHGSGINLLNNNNNNSANNNNNSDNNNCSSNKLNDIRLSGQYGVETDLHVANRMSLMAAASAAAAAVAASAGSRAPQETIDTATSMPDSAAVQAAVVNLAAAMRINQQVSSAVTNSAGSFSHPNQPTNNLLHHQQPHQQQHQHQTNHGQQQPSAQSGTCRSPPVHVPSLQTEAVMNAMIRGPLDPTHSGMHHHHHQLQMHQPQQQHQPQSMDTSALSQQQQPSSTNLQSNQSANYSQHTPGTGAPSHPHQSLQPHPHHVTHHQHNPETALRMQQQAEALLRSHTEVAFRLAASVVATNGVNANPKNDSHPHAQHIPLLGNEHPSQSQSQRNSSTSISNPTNAQHQEQQASSDHSETGRLQEHRLEQALRLHSDARTLNYLTVNNNGNPDTNQQPQLQQHQQQQQQQHAEQQNPLTSS